MSGRRTVEDPRPGVAVGVFLRLLAQDHGREHAAALLAETARRTLLREVPQRDRQNAQYVSWHTLFAVMRDEGIATIDGESLDGIERRHGERYGPPSFFLDRYPREWRDDLPPWAEEAVIRGLARARGEQPPAELPSRRLRRSREELIREAIAQATGLERSAMIDAYRLLIEAHLVGGRGRAALGDLEETYADQGVFAGTRNADGTLRFALDSAADMLEAEVEFNTALSPDARSALAEVLRRLVSSGAFPPATGAALERARAAGLRAGPPASATGGAALPLAEVRWHPYVPTPERPPAIQRDPFPVDPDALDRATLQHQRTQNALALAAAEHGFDVVSSEGEPRVDVAWSDGTSRTIAEVKTINAKNEAKQLRIGLGQLLDYHDQIAAAGEEVELVLATDREPTDGRWSRICATCGVRLVWPGAFEKAFLGYDGASDRRSVPLTH